MKTTSLDLDRWKVASLALIPVFLILIGVLATLNIPGSLEHPFVLAFLNTLFLGIIPIVIAFLSYKVVSRSGSASVFLLGSGVLIFGLGSIVAGWVNPLPGGPNMTVTIHNTCAFIGSILIFAGAVIRRPGSKTGAGSVSAGMVAAAFAGIFIFVAALSFAALQGLTPPFFVPGSGPTVLRQVVLENAVLLFAISSCLFMAVWRRERSDFFFWYSGALALIAIGLLAVFVQPSVGSITGWVGRFAQYLGFVYALNAILIARKTAVEKGLTLEKVIADFFMDAEQSYTTLVETATDAIVVFDSDDRVIVWNKAAEEVFGYRKEEAMGSSFMDLAIPEESAGIIKNNFRTPASHRSVEIVARRKNGSLFPAEMALSWHMVAGTRVNTCIVHDLTWLKKTETELKRKNEDLLALNEELTSTQEELHQRNDELIRSEGELGVKNAQLQAVFDYSAASLVLFDAKKPYTVLAHNTFYQILWAEPFRSQGLVGKNLYDYVPKVEVSGVMEVYDEVVRTRQAKTLLNFPYDGMDQGRTYWNWHLSPVIKDGELVALAHMAVDVTNEVVARLKTEEMASAIRESEARFRSVLDNSRDFIYRTNLQTGRYEYVSPSVKEVLGYEPDEFASMGTQTSMATIHPNDLAFVMKAMERLEDTGTAEVEYRLRNKQGEYRWVSNNLSVIKDSSGRPLYRSGSVRDITERKKVDEALRLSERNLATSQEIAAVGSYTWDLKTNQMHWSDELYRILGLVPGEMPPAFDTYTAFIFPDDREETIRKSRRMNETGETRPNEHRIVRADGTVRTVQVNSRVFSTMDGRPSVLHGVVQDITERKQAEEEVRRKNIDLNALNEELTAAEEELKQNIEDLCRNQEVLRQNEERLKSALAEKEILLAEIHHRVKNNLTAFISLLSLEGSTEDTSTGLELRKDLQNRARSMALIHETLYKTHQFSSVDMDAYLTPLIDQIVNSYSSPQSIKIVVEAKDMSLDLARATPIGLIVNELVTNSLKHAFPHGCKECRAGQNDPCTIGVRLAKEDGSYLMSVTDNGVGLPAGFDPLTAKTLGLKLVTFLAKHQVRATMEVKTEKGTEFIFRFKE